MKSIGTICRCNLEGYCQWLSMSPVKKVRNQAQKVCESFPPYHQCSEEEKIYTSTIAESYINTMGFVCARGEEELRKAEDEAVGRTIQKTVERIRRVIDYSEEFEQPIHVGYWSDDWAYLFMGNPSKGMVILNPTKWLTLSPMKDWSSFTPAEARLMLGMSREEQDSNLLSLELEESMSPAQAAHMLEERRALYSSVKEDIDACRHYEFGELAEMKAKIKKLEQEMYDRKEQLLASLNNKRREMEKQMAQMEDQIFLLDAQIYTIICRLGEAISFTKLRSGKNAPVTEPIIVHQKLRFLDEELGLLASLYNIQWDEISEFERFLKHSPEALDTFAPQERCVQLVRLSRTGTLLDRDSEYPYTNILKEYQYYHGKTVGIIIRNGENVYIGWTDEMRVHIDDDLIINSAITKIEPAEMPEFTFESDRDKWEEEERNRKRKIMDGLVSRSYVYNILQGIVENSDMLPLPPGIKLNKQSKYVQYSVADKWLIDNRFGDFDSIIKKVNERVQVGDFLLTMQSLIPEHYRNFVRSFDTSKAWENVRGRGDANRTHDVAAEDCTIYRANVVEYDEPVEMVDFDIPKPAWQRKQATPEDPEYYYHHNVRADNYDRMSQDDKDNAILRNRYTIRNRHVFISLEKTGCYSWDGYKSDARANFELYQNEYLNLTYLNSVWLTWFITNRRLGNWRIAGMPVSYAHGIRYLKTALDFVRKREIEEKKLLDEADPTICKDSDWPLALSEWKLDKGVRTITSYQAKRFAHWWTESQHGVSSHQD